MDLSGRKSEEKAPVDDAESAMAVEARQESPLEMCDPPAEGNEALLDFGIARRLAVLFMLRDRGRRCEFMAVPFLPPTEPPLIFDQKRRAMFALSAGTCVVDRKVAEAYAEEVGDKDLIDGGTGAVCVVTIPRGGVVPQGIARYLWGKGFRDFAEALRESTATAKAAFEELDLDVGGDVRQDAGFSRIVSFEKRSKRLAQELEWHAERILDADLSDPEIWIREPWRVASDIKEVLGGADCAKSLLEEEACERIMPRMDDTFRRFMALPKPLDARPVDTVERRKIGASGCSGLRQVSPFVHRRLDENGLVVLTQDERERVFADCLARKGAVNDGTRGFLPGSVVILPQDGSPPYYRGRGQVADRTGSVSRRDMSRSILVEKLDDELIAALCSSCEQAVGNFRQRREQRVAARALGERRLESDLSEQSLVFAGYSGGFRWFVDPWTGELVDEDSSDLFARINRSWNRLMAPVYAGHDIDGIAGLEANPWRWGSNVWGFAGVGREPERLRQFFAVVGEPRRTEFFSALAGKRPEPDEWIMRGHEAHRLDDIGYFAEPASFEREWQRPGHNLRFLGDCLGDLVEDPVVKVMLGLSVREEVDRAAFEAKLDAYLAARPEAWKKAGQEQVEMAIAETIDSGVQKVVAWRDGVETARLEAYQAWVESMRRNCRLAYVPDPRIDGDQEVVVADWEPDLWPEPDEPIIEGLIGCGGRIRQRYEDKAAADLDGEAVAASYWPELRSQTKRSEQRYLQLEKGQA